MSYRGPYIRHLEKQGVTPPRAPNNWWLQPWVIIILGAALFAVVGTVEALLVGYLPWGSISQPGLWKIPASFFLVGVLAAFCIAAEALRWFGKYRKIAQTLAGLCVGLAIILLFPASFTVMAVAASVGSVAGYFGEQWGKGL